MRARVKLRQAAREYVEHSAAKGLAAGTVKSRQQGMAAMVRVLGDVQVWAMTGQHLDKVFSAHAWSVGTRNMRLAIYKGFFAWCRSRAYLHRDVDPAFGWRYQHVTEQPQLHIPHQEWPKLFGACMDPVETIALATGLYLFLRGSEQRHIQLKHVHLDDGELEIYRPKVRRWDVMPICLELDGYLRQQLTWMASQVNLEPEHYLIPTRFAPRQAQGTFTAGSGPLNPSKPFCRPYSTVQGPLGRAGYPTAGQGEHTLRRSGARAYFDHLVSSGWDGALKRVQSMLGHKHAAMTERYLGLDLERSQRNQALKGHWMFPAAHHAQVIPIRKDAADG